jgi:hypothetical protein
MSVLMIFLIGVTVAAIVLIAAVAVGIGEAADPAHSKLRNLSDWERKLVERERARQAAEARRT